MTSENETPVAEESAPNAVPTKKNPKLLIAVAAAAAAIIVILLGLQYYGKITATTMSLQRTQGTVSISNENGKNITPKEQLKLYSGYSMGTEPVSYAWIDLDKVKLVKMDENSEIEIQKEGKNLKLLVNSGNLFFNVSEPLADDETMSIRTSTLMVGIRGTCGWVVSDAERGAQVYILEGKVEAKTVDTGEVVTVSAGEMAQVSITEDGKTELTVQPFAEEYIPEFVQIELEENTDLSAAVLAASGLDVLNPPDPAERLQAEYQEVIMSYSVLDYSVTDIYTIDDVDYGPEGLTFVCHVDLDHDGIEELLLVSGLRRTLNYGDSSYTYYTDVNKIEVYGSVYGYPQKLGEYVLISDEEFAICEQDFIDPENYGGLSLVENEERTYICIDGSIQDSYWYQYYYLENGDLLYLGSQAAIGSNYEVKPPNDMSEFSDTAQYMLLVGDDLPNNLCPKIPEDIQRKNQYLNEISDDNQYDAYYFADLRDINGDGVEELITLGEVTGTFCYFSWDSTDNVLLRTELESGIVYAKLIDLNNDGNEDLLLLKSSENHGNPKPLFRAYLWNESGCTAVSLGEDFYSVRDEVHLDLYREKNTGEIYVCITDGFSRGFAEYFWSISDSVEYHFSDGSGGFFWTQEEEDAAIMQAEEENQRQAAERDKRFDKIEDIGDWDAWAGAGQYVQFSFEESNLSETVEAVKQQLMER